MKIGENSCASDQGAIRQYKHLPACAHIYVCSVFYLLHLTQGGKGDLFLGGSIYKVLPALEKLVSEE